MTSIIKLALIAVFMILCLGNVEEADEGFEPLCDGTTLRGWMGATDAAYIENGELVVKQGAQGTLISVKEYSDFVIRFEFQLTSGANNGLGIRVPTVGHPSYDGIELQILDDSAEKYKSLKPYQYHGSVYGIAPALRGHLKPLGDWNHEEVCCHGQRVTVCLNGVMILDVKLDEVAPLGKTIDGESHSGLSKSKGHIGILCHGDSVKFRNMRIKEL